MNKTLLSVLICTVALAGCKKTNQIRPVMPAPTSKQIKPQQSKMRVQSNWEHQATLTEPGILA